MCTINQVRKADGLTLLIVSFYALALEYPVHLPAFVYNRYIQLYIQLYSVKNSFLSTQLWYFGPHI